MALRPLGEPRRSLADATTEAAGADVTDAPRLAARALDQWVRRGRDRAWVRLAEAQGGAGSRPGGGQRNDTGERVGPRPSERRCSAGRPSASRS
ncbi:MAG: hypothetical protein IPN17_22545 [Deltaproteobacteria bacterium]|nr:hypothetical protein [Deltaproteobacteria bacterium]